MKRDESIDTMRGIGAFLVMWSHAGSETDGYFTVISPIMLPVFFLVSGYLFKPEKMGIKDFIKTRLISLLGPWIIISYVQAYFNVSDIKRILKDFGVIKEIGIDCTLRILSGTAVWFIPALAVSLSIAYGIIKVCKNHKKSLAVSFTVSILAWYFLREIEILNIWSICGALINQVFIVAGYCMKHRLDEQDTRMRIIAHKVWIPVFVIEEILFMKLFSWQGFAIRYNGIENILEYYILCFSGLFAVYALTRKWSRIPLITFMGTHSLLYFAFGPHGYVIGRKILEILSVNIRNENISTLIIAFIASVAWIIPARIIDKVCPILNGKVRS